MRLGKKVFVLGIVLLLGIFTISQVSYATKFVDDLRARRGAETEQREIVDGAFGIAETIDVVSIEGHTLGVNLSDAPFLLGDRVDIDSAVVTTDLPTDLSIAIAAGLMYEGWVGKAAPSEIDALGDVGKIAKQLGKEMDARANIILIDTAEASRTIVHVMGSEGEADDLPPEALLSAGQVLNPQGDKGTAFLITDEVDGTNLTVTNNNGEAFEERNPWHPGGISMNGTGDIVQKRGLGSDRWYKAGLFFSVPGDAREAFTANPIDPQIPDSLEEAQRYIRTALTRIALANGKELNDIEVVLMRRGREQFKKDILDSLGVEWHDFPDGTPGHALLANLQPNTGKVRVFWTVMKSIEGGWNEAVADALYQAGYGAIGYTKIYSTEINFADDKIGAPKSEREKSTNMARRYVWSEEVETKIKEIYPNDWQDILTGRKIFVTGQATGTLDAAMTFITDNRLFGLRGAGEVQADGTIEVPTLRVKAVQEAGEWKCYVFIENRVVDYRTYSLKGLIASSPERDASWLTKLGSERTSISSEEKTWLEVLLGLRQKGQKTARRRKIGDIIDGVIQGRLALELNERGRIASIVEIPSFIAAISSGDQARRLALSFVSLSNPDVPLAYLTTQQYAVNFGTDAVTAGEELDLLAANLDTVRRDLRYEDTQYFHVPEKNLPTRTGGEAVELAVAQGAVVQAVNPRVLTMDAYMKGVRDTGTVVMIELARSEGGSNARPGYASYPEQMVSALLRSMKKYDIAGEQVIPHLDHNVVAFKPSAPGSREVQVAEAIDGAKEVVRDWASNFAGSFATDASQAAYHEAEQDLLGYGVIEQALRHELYGDREISAEEQIRLEEETTRKRQRPNVEATAIMLGYQYDVTMGMGRLVDGEVETGHIGEMDPMTKGPRITTGPEAVTYLDMLFTEIDRLAEEENWVPEKLQGVSNSVRLLAIQTGSIHGHAYNEQGQRIDQLVDPTINERSLEQCRAIQRAVDEYCQRTGRPRIYLVLHGTTGITREGVKERVGIYGKANVATVYQVTVFDTLLQSEHPAAIALADRLSNAVLGKPLSEFTPQDTKAFDKGVKAKTPHDALGGMTGLQFMNAEFVKLPPEVQEEINEAVYKRFIEYTEDFNARNLAARIAAAPIAPPSVLMGGRSFMDQVKNLVQVKFLLDQGGELAATLTRPLEAEFKAHAYRGTLGKHLDDLRQEAERQGVDVAHAIAFIKVERAGIIDVVMASTVLSAENISTDDATFIMSDITLNTHPNVRDAKSLSQGLLNLGLLQPGALRDGNQYELAFASPAEREFQVVLFTDDYARNRTEEFLREVDDLGERQIAVIISTHDARESLLELPGIQDGVDNERIKIISVEGGSTAALAFERLFSGQNFFDLGQITTIGQLLSNENLVDALEGSV